MALINNSLLLVDVRWKAIQYILIPFSCPFIGEFFLHKGTGVLGDLLQVGVVQSPDDIFGSTFWRVIFHNETCLSIRYYVPLPDMTVGLKLSSLRPFCLAE